MGTSAPSGTVTFLFTDIEGSTCLWEACRVHLFDSTHSLPLAPSIYWSRRRPIVRSMGRS